MSRKAMGMIVLAAAVMLTTGAGSGGCGSSGDTGAPQVGAGGEQSQEQVPDDPCPVRFANPPIMVNGNTISAAVRVGPCSADPKEYQGDLFLQYSETDHPFNFVPLKHEYVSSPRDTPKTASAQCKVGFWVVYYSATGRDAKGRDFKPTKHNEPTPPLHVEKCP